MKQISWWFIMSQNIKNAIFQALCIARVVWVVERVVLFLHPCNRYPTELIRRYLSVVLVCIFSAFVCCVFFFWKVFFEEYRWLSCSVASYSHHHLSPTQTCHGTLLNITPSHSNFSDTLRARTGRFTFSLALFCWALFAALGKWGSKDIKQWEETKKHPLRITLTSS